MYWLVIAQVIKRTRYGERSKQIPTFYLNGDVQGITNADTAIQLAKEIIDPFGLLEVHVSVSTVFEVGKGL